MKKKRSQRGTSIGLVKLRRMFGRGGEVILLHSEHIRELTRAKRQKTRFRILTTELPDKQHFDRMKATAWTKTLVQWLEDANAEIEELREEMVNWRDEIEPYDGLRESDKGSRVIEAADTLESIEELDWGDIRYDVAVHELHIAPEQLLISGRAFFKRKRTGRAARASEVSEILGQVKSCIEELRPNEDETSFCETLDQTAMEMDNLDFPGMFG